MLLHEIYADGYAKEGCVTYDSSYEQLNATIRQEVWGILLPSGCCPYLIPSLALTVFQEVICMPLCWLSITKYIVFEWMAQCRRVTCGTPAHIYTRELFIITVVSEYSSSVGNKYQYSHLKTRVLGTVTALYWDAINRRQWMFWMSCM